MKISRSFTVLAMLIATVGCKKEPSAEPHCKFVDCAVETASRSAQISFQVEIPETFDTQTVGILVSRTENPSSDASAFSREVKKNKESVYSFNIPDLEPATQYWYQPVVTSWDDTCEYGETGTFTTLSAKMLNGHEYVNLGLKSGTKWASFNMDDSGEIGRFAWDEPDNFVRESWGAPWRMPTKEDWNELMADCFWSWDIQNGMEGMLVKGPNGNSIFLPAEGYMVQGHLMSVGEYGAYWTADVIDSAPGYSWILFFGMDFVYWYNFPQSSCASIRPVNNSTFYDYD